MKHSRLVRAVTVAAIITGALAMYASSAAAAGKPTITSPNARARISSFNVSAQVNPNGASTTYVTEYGLTPSLGSVSATGSAGSGTTNVGVQSLVAALKPGTTYYWRLTATNSFGSTSTSTTTVTAQSWQSWKALVTWPATYVSSGTYKFEIPSLNVTLTCDESGSGVIGNSQGVGDEINSQFSNCLLVGGTTSCKVSPFSMTLNGSFQSTKSPNVVTFETPQSCSWVSETTTLSSSSGFEAVIPEAFAVKPAVSTTMTAKFGMHDVYITGTSTWELTGANAGKKFGVG
jgi:hypothetical protein